MESDEDNIAKLRYVNIGRTEDESAFIKNELSSASYTWLSFFPKNLFEQFQRTSNIWFLIVSIFQLLPLNLHSSSSWGTMAPLCVLLLTSMVIDGFNDVKRRKEDKKFNSLEYLVWKDENFALIKSKDIRVGDLLLIEDGQIVPADVLLLGIGADQSECFADVSSIEGRFDLKKHRAVEETQRRLRIENDTSALARTLTGQAVVSQPNPDFNRFSGELRLDSIIKAIKLNTHELLLRESVLRGTPRVLVLVLYTGTETKTILNVKTPAKKISRIEKQVNKWVVFVLLVLLGLVLFSTITYFTLSVSEFEMYNFFESFVIFLLMYNNIIPISLFIVLDIVRFCQIFYIQSRCKNHVKFKTGDLNEDLGQVEYILTDKSGTLTEGNLHVARCIVNETIFINNEKNRADKDLDLKVFANEKLTEWEDYFSDFEDLKSVIKESLHSTHYHFIRGMTLCNNLTSENFGTSSEEIALVETAKTLGIEVLENHPGRSVIVTHCGKESYSVVCRTEFSSTLRRSRVLIRSEDSGNGILYVKGAGDVMGDLVVNSDWESLDRDVKSMNDAGIRSIVLAFREVSAEELDDIEQRADRASRSVLNSSTKTESLFQNIEKDLTYTGIVGFEEDIQDQVIDTVSALKGAGIKIWVVSGDTEGSVLSASHKSKIIPSQSKICFLTRQNNTLMCFKQLQNAVKEFIYQEAPSRNMVHRQTMPSARTDENLNVHRYSELIYSNSNRADILMPLFEKLTMQDAQLLKKKFDPKIDFCVSIDRHLFRESIKDNSCRKMLTALLFTAESVLCHDFLPKDKADLTILLKENMSFKPLVLAIGNGNNDIAMIQESNIGIGIDSQTGGAKFFSEVVVSHFSDLKELVLLHGHWNYSRICRIVLLFLYKNFILTVAIFAYIFVSDFSGLSIFDSGLFFGYNLLFTTLPIMVMGIFDQDLSTKQIYSNSSVYCDGISGTLFTVRKLLTYAILSFIQGMIIVLTIAYSMDEIISSDGTTESYDVLGTTIFASIVFTVLAQMLLDTYNYSIYFISSILLSIMIFIFFLLFYSVSDVFSSELLGVFTAIVYSPLAIILIFTPALLCFGVSFSIYLYKFLIYPGRVEKILLGAEESSIEGFNRREVFAERLDSVYRQTAVKQEVIEESYELHKYSLHFKSSNIEKRYQDRFIKNYIKFYQFLITFFWVLLILWTLIEAFALEAELLLTIMRILICVLFSIILILVFTKSYKDQYTKYNILIITIAILIKFAVEISFVMVGFLSQACIPAITNILFNIDFLKVTLANVLSLVLLLIELISYTIIESYSSEEAIIFILAVMTLSISITVTSAYVGYVLERSSRLEFKLIEQKEVRKQKAQKIFSLLFPDFVRKRVIKGDRCIVDDQGIVTVIFCDICDFDELSLMYTPEELIAVLDDWFKIFDQLCEAAGVTKIETVGKTYMACAGLKVYENEVAPELQRFNHARRAVEFSLDVIWQCQQIFLKNKENLKVKIGLHSGPVIAGVVGFHKPQFSLVGDTVNTASRMCSTNKMNSSIQVSEDTYTFLQGISGLNFEPNEVEVKGKGKMMTYKLFETYSEITTERGRTKRHGNLSKSLNTANSFYESGIRDAYVSNVKIFDCSVEETENEKALRINKMNGNLTMIRVALVAAIFNFSVLLLLSISEEFVLDDFSDEYILVMRSACIVLFCFVLLFLKKIFLERIYSWMIILILNLCLYTVLLYVILDTERDSDLVVLEVMYIVLLLNYGSGASVTLQIIGSSLVSIPWMVIAFMNRDAYIHAANTLFVLGFSVMNISAVYTREKSLRTYTNLEKSAEVEIKETNELLQHMIPHHVLEDMRAGRGTTDTLQNVTLMYADIAGYTSWSSNKTPREVVEMLSKMFTKFDKKCIEHNVYKVHTIGDCYVVLGYNNNEHRDPGQECLNVLSMAYSMIQIINKVNLKMRTELSMRIGIHTGQVIAGITGTSIVRYDIYGPDVVVANKMESEGQIGNINVSNVTRNIIEERSRDKYDFIFNKRIEIQSLDRVHDCYFVQDLGNIIAK